jgi:hypothetical protein
MKKHIGITILVMSIFVLPGCFEKQVRPDTPVNTANMAKLAIDSGNYQSFNDLFSEGRKDYISKEKFNQLKGLSSASATYTNYQLVTFQNGKMVLIRLTQERDPGGNYRIEDMKIVPEGLADIFKP